MTTRPMPDLLPGEQVIWSGGPAPRPYRLRFDWLGVWCGAMAVILLFVGLFLGEVVPLVGMVLFAGVTIWRLLPAPLGRRAEPPVYVLTDRRVILHEPALKRTRAFTLDQITPRLEAMAQGGTVWLITEPEGPPLGSRLVVRPVALGFVEVGSPGHVMDLLEDARAARAD